MRTGSRVAITSAAPTIYFIRDSEALKQGYDLSIDNPGREFDGRLVIGWGRQSCDCDLGRIQTGKSTVRAYIPDIRRPVRLIFALSDAKLVVDHRPQRHWSVHIIQFAHHDLGYTDLPSNVLREYCGFYDDALRFCAETDAFPDDSKFRYTIEQGWSLLYYLDHRPPAVRDEMIRRIKEGRIEVNAFVGNEVTELLGPEEMARMLYPVFGLKRRYGIPVTTAEHNDIPGISWGVAAALVAAGIRYFAPGLPDYFRWGPHYHTFWDEEAVVPGGRPHAFYWQAPSGEKVLFWYHRHGAGGTVDVSLSDLPRHLEDLEEKAYPYDVLRYMVRGGDRDNSNTRVEFAHTCRDWNSRYAYPRLIPSLNSRFFPDLEKQLSPDTPTWRGELPATDYSAAASCTAYASSLNRVTHDQLMMAERFASVASEITDYKYPRQAIDEAYHCTLMNDEHAWGLAHPTGPGQDACIAQHCEFAYRAAALAHDVLTKAINEIADRISRDEDGCCVAVFNPLGTSRTDIVAAPVRPMDPCARQLRPDPDRRTDLSGRPIAFYAYPVCSRGLYGIPWELITGGLRVVDVANGSTVPHEIYEVPNAQAPAPYAGYRYALGQHSRAEVVDVRFVASDVPPMGYKLYKLVSNARARKSAHGLKTSAAAIENRFYRLELDPRTGAIRSLIDKELDRELIDGSSEHLGNQLIIRSSITGEISTSDTAAIERGRAGPVSGSLVVRTCASGYPQITQEIILYDGLKRIDIGNRMLKDSTAHLETYFAFPFDIDEPRFRYEGSLSVIEPLVDQFPGSNSEYYAVQHWADVHDSKSGITLVSLDAPMMMFGGLWPLYISQAHHGVTPPGFDHPFHTADDVKKGHIYSFVLLNNYRTNFTPVQSGDVLFRYSITSHAGDWREGRARDFGYSVGLPLVPVNLQGACEGDLPSSTSFCRIEPENAILLALKRAEDGRGFIVRVMETEGRDTEVTISLPFVAIDTAWETNLVEEDLRLIPMDAHSVRVPVKAWGTATVRLS